MNKLQVIHRIKSIHRIIKYWEHRLGQLAASGLNTVSFYIPWNFHEEQKGIFNFSGNRDLRKFIKIAEKLHLHVIIRVGPYICAEWEWGGLPPWLLINDNLKIRLVIFPKMSIHRKVFRTNTPAFIEPTRIWLTRLIEEIKDLQHSQNGPIIAIQVKLRLPV